MNQELMTLDFWQDTVIYVTAPKITSCDVIFECF